jgi:hypothetical protein
LEREIDILGTYGVALDEGDEFAALAKEFEEKPYADPPVAPHGTECAARPEPRGNRGSPLAASGRALPY